MPDAHALNAQALAVVFNPERFPADRDLRYLPSFWREFKTPGILHDWWEGNIWNIPAVTHATQVEVHSLQLTVSGQEPFRIVLEENQYYLLIGGSWNAQANWRLQSWWGLDLIWNSDSVRISHLAAMACLALFRVKHSIYSVEYSIPRGHQHKIEGHIFDISSIEHFVDGVMQK